MMSTNNILSPASGKPIIVPTQDMVLGIYYMTRPREFAHGEGMTFASADEVRAAYDHGVVAAAGEDQVPPGQEDVRDHGRSRAARDIVPAKVGFDEINKVLDKKQLGNLIDTCYRLTGEKETVLLADRIRSFGYTYATRPASRSR
jgi:DNA-directed RNA polymerase subunit beta'